MNAGKDFNIAPAAPSQINRIESGMLSYGSDMSLKDNPYDVSLGKFVDLDKKADFLVFIDDDEIADKNWLENLIINQSKYKADIITGPVLCCFEQKPTNVLEEVFFKRKRLNTGTKMKNCATGNVLINLNVFDKVGKDPFNISFGLMGGEDSDFFKRIRLHNIDIIWCDEAITSELISKERSQFKACLYRTFYSGNSSYYILKLNSNFLIRIFKVITNLLQVIISPIFLVLNILFINKLNFIIQIKKIFKSLGFISAAFGYKNKQYNIIYGE